MKGAMSCIASTYKRLLWFFVFICGLLFPVNCPAISCFCLGKSEYSFTDSDEEDKSTPTIHYSHDDPLNEIALRSVNSLNYSLIKLIESSAHSDFKDSYTRRVTHLIYVNAGFSEGLRYYTTHFLDQHSVAYAQEKRERWRLYIGYIDNLYNEIELLVGILNTSNNILFD